MGIIPSYVQNFCSLWLLWPPQKARSWGRLSKVTQKLSYRVNCPFSGPNSGLGTWCPSSQSDHWFWDYGTGGYIKTRVCATTHMNLVTMKAKMELEWATMPRYYICNTCLSFWPCVEAKVPTESRNFEFRKVQCPLTTPKSFTFVTSSTFWWSW